MATKSTMECSSDLRNFHLDCLSSVKAGLSLELDQLEKCFEGTSFSPLLCWHYQLDIKLHLFRSFERTETAKRIALIALALEREKLATGKYPAQLSGMKEELELVDLTGPERRQLSYELGPDGRPVIWSIYEQE